MPKKAAGSMDVDSMIKGLIAGLDAQISELVQKKNALVNAFGGSTKAVAAPAAVAAAAGERRRGRPPGSTNKKGTKVAAPAVAADKPAAKKGKKKRVFSEETKRKLAVKAKARWAKIRAEQGQG